MIMVDNDAARVSVVGCGRLGLCAALCFERAGFDVLACDTDAAYVAALNARRFESREPGVSERLRAARRFRATGELAAAAAHAACLFVFVDTPTGSAGTAYDHSKLSRVLQALAGLRVRPAHVVVGCTVLPGYCDSVGAYLLRDCPDVTLSYSPEFIAQGDILRGFVEPDIVLIGAPTPAAGDAIEAIYARTVRNAPRVCRMSRASAELAKLALNCFITMKIAFANSIADLAASTDGANAADILEAVGSDARVGLRCLKPGYGFGGPCFPRDNQALGNYAASIGHEPVLPRATDAANEQHRAFQVQQLLAAHDAAHRFVFDSVTYKPDCPVPIIEHSQKLLVAAAVARAGRAVAIRDRRDVIDAVGREYGGLFTYEER